MEAAPVASCQLLAAKSSSSSTSAAFARGVIAAVEQTAKMLAIRQLANQALGHWKFTSQLIAGLADNDELSLAVESLAELLTMPKRENDYDYD